MSQWLLTRLCDQQGFLVLGLREVPGQNQLGCSVSTAYPQKTLRRKWTFCEQLHNGLSQNLKRKAKTRHVKISGVDHSTREDFTW